MATDAYDTIGLVNNISETKVFHQHNMGCHFIHGKVFESNVYFHCLRDQPSAKSSIVEYIEEAEHCILKSSKKTGARLSLHHVKPRVNGVLAVGIKRCCMGPKVRQQSEDA